MGVQISGDTGNVLATKGTYTGNLTVGGVLTYEDVTNVDSVGLVTARSGIEIGARPGVAASISVDGNMIISGISTFGDDITFTGATSGRDVVFDTSLNQMRAQDNAKLCAGTSSDLEIYHNATNSYIDNYTGHIYVRNNLSTDNGGNIYLQAKSGEDGIIVNDDGAVELYHDNVKTFETSSNGATILAGEGGSAYLYMSSDEGDDNGDKWQLKIDNGDQAFMIKNYASGSWETSLECNGNGNVELYNDNTLRAYTTNVGLHVDTILSVPDSGKLRCGAGDDLEIHHTSDNSYIANDTGYLYIQSDSISLAAKSAGENFLVANKDGAVHLYYDNANKLSTTTEGTKITGYIKATSDGNLVNTGVFHESFQTFNNQHVHWFQHNGSTSSQQYGIRVKTADDGNDTLSLLQCSSGSASAGLILRNGSFQSRNNSFGGISDIKLKENIVDANSQWDDIKNIKVRNFNFKDNPTKKMLGVIAQEIELVSAGLVEDIADRDPDTNEDLGTVTKHVKSSILYMKAIKALQEAQTRIETLETEVAALKSS